MVNTLDKTAIAIDAAWDVQGALAMGCCRRVFNGAQIYMLRWSLESLSVPGIMKNSCDVDWRRHVLHDSRSTKLLILWNGSLYIVISCHIDIIYI